MPGLARMQFMPTGLIASTNVALPDEGLGAAILFQGSGYTFNWDGTSDAGSKVSSGNYHFQVTINDSFGGQATLNTSVAVLRTPNTVMISIFNSAGELVRRFQPASATGGSVARTDLASFSPDPTNNIKVRLTYGEGTGDYVLWDGTNASGALVASGTYQVLVTREAPGGKRSSASISVSVLQSNAAPLAEVVAAPNPVVHSDFVDLIAPNLGPGGWMIARAYNAAGEKVAQADGASSRLRLSWSGKKLAGGIYLLHLQAQDQNGRIATKILKVALVQ